MAKNKRKNDVRQTLNIKHQFTSIDVGVKDGVFIFTAPLTIDEFAKKLNKPAMEIVKYFFMKGKMSNLNTILNEEEIGEICFNYDIDFDKQTKVDASNILDNIKFQDEDSDLIERAPVITIMGHVDHGKTTLLDTIRLTNVVDGEFGGITQHIGAYQVTHNSKPITFIDTPGHEAFTKMRALGANITDIVILVVAADDGIKVQTEEAIDHAKAANVPVIVFVNKMDKPGANPERVMSQLAERDLTPEEWGGKTMFIKGSALKKEGISDLLESITLLAEVENYKSNPNRLATGVTIESHLEKGHGPIATLLIKSGTLQKSDYVVIGGVHGKIRSIFNDLGQTIDKAYPGQPVKITGLDAAPDAGASFAVLHDEREAKELAKKIKDVQINKEWSRVGEGSIVNEDEKKLYIVLKADVSGSLDAIKNLLGKIAVDGVQLKIIRSAVGNISESDVQLAKAAKGIIVGFNIKPQKIVKDVADSQNVRIFFYNIIYKLGDDITNMLLGTLDPVSIEEELGEAEVKQIWHHSSIGTICGCLVTSGTITRNSKTRILRDGKVIYSTTISSLRHKKDNISSTSSGKECGIVFDKFHDVKEGDVIQAYKIVEKTAAEVKDGK